MNVLNELLTNDDVNLWNFAGSANESKTAIDAAIQAANKEQLTELVIKFEGHSQFRAETFTCYDGHSGNCSLNEDEYEAILDEYDL